MFVSDYFVDEYGGGAERSTDALNVLLEADLAGAHNYLIFDSSGDGYNIEAMPSVRPVNTLGADPLVHTNHTIQSGLY